MKSQAHEQFEETKIEAVRENNVELVQDILKELSPIAHRSQAAEELVRILKEPHFQVCGSWGFEGTQAKPLITCQSDVCA